MLRRWYTCRESATTISHSVWSARLNASGDWPMRVGRTMTGTRVIVASSVVENSHRLVNHRTSSSARPPLWLVASVVAAFWSAAYDIQQWVTEFVRSAVHVDFATFYIAAEAGMRYGWSSMYDRATLQALATTHGLPHDYISSAQVFANPPAFAWLLVPLTVLTIPAAYLVWTIVSLGALVWAWYVAAPYAGLGKLTLLLVALVSVAALGSTGLTNWWHALNYLQSNSTHSHVTIAYVFGQGPVAYALEGLQGVAALVIAWRRRTHLEVVFAAGLVGSLAASFHLHQPDYSSLLLWGWLVLRASPPLWHRLWFLA